MISHSRARRLWRWLIAPIDRVQARRKVSRWIPPKTRCDICGELPDRIIVIADVDEFHPMWECPNYDGWMEHYVDWPFWRDWIHERDWRFVGAEVV